VKLTTHLHLLPKSKNEWSYTSIPQYTFMAWFSVKRNKKSFKMQSHKVSILNIVRVIKSRRSEFDGTSSTYERSEIHKIYKILLGNLKGKEVGKLMSS
jgi:hypothetical protein